MGAKSSTRSFQCEETDQKLDGEPDARISCVATAVTSLKNGTGINDSLRCVTSIIMPRSLCHQTLRSCDRYQFKVMLIVSARPTESERHTRLCSMSDSSRNRQHQRCCSETSHTIMPVVCFHRLISLCNSVPVVSSLAVVSEEHQTSPCELGHLFELFLISFLNIHNDAESDVSAECRAFASVLGHAITAHSE
jgi:hypothetical protein